MKFWMTVLAATMMTAMMFGCRKQAPKDVRYADLPGDAVVLRVGDAKLSKADLEREIALKTALAKMKDPKFSEMKAAELRRRTQDSASVDFIRRQLLLGYAEANDLPQQEKELNAAKDRIARTFVGRKKGFEGLMRRLPEDLAGELECMVSREVRCAQASDALTKKTVTPVTDDEIVRRRRYFEKYNEIANATNALIWAQASNVWQAVKGDTAKFDETARRYEEGDFERISGNTDMGELELSFFSDEPWFADCLKKMKPGEITPPMIGDNGLMIAKLIAFTPADTSKGQQNDLYRLARIYFEIAELWEPETDEEIRADLEKIHRREALQKGLEDLYGKTTVEYPYGTNIFMKVKSPKRATPKLPKGAKLPKGVGFSK